ncbi:hypothetical protein [Pseudomonas sp. NPDC089569]|uniref:hypothetical protein n=1 Tax=Pseudomonas sp. NPDC089569 TaxID=3390722 RepID=UPI003D04CA3F
MLSITGKDISAIVHLTRDDDYLTPKTQPSNIARHYIAITLDFQRIELRWDKSESLRAGISLKCSVPLSLVSRWMKHKD